MQQNKPQLTLQERKAIMLEIMESLVEYFDKYNLKYCLIAGTLIGAVRHKGFIPWDDDMDIGMPIDDYKKLLSYSISDPISEDVFLSSVETNPDHIWPMAKAISKKTSLVEMNVLKKYRAKQEKFGGVYVDIFPIYGLPDKEKERRSHCDSINKYYSYAKHASRLIRFREGYGSKIRKVLYFICFIPFRVIGVRFFLERLLSKVGKYPYHNDGYAAFGLGLVKNYKDVFPADQFTNTMDNPFENLNLEIPVEYDSILTSQYGDYMKVPPENERKTHPGVATLREL